MGALAELNLNENTSNVYIISEGFAYKDGSCYPTPGRVTELAFDAHYIDDHNNQQAFINALTNYGFDRHIVGCSLCIMRFIFICITICSVFINCEKKKKEKFSENHYDKTEDSIQIKNKRIEKERLRNDSLLTFQNFESSIGKLLNVTSSKNHSDWMANRGGFIDKLLELKVRDYSVQTKAYVYKDSCIFYIHSLSHNKKEILSFRPFLTKIEGKRSYSKLSERVLIFALKNEKEANFIDIPPNWGYSKIRTELIRKIYANLNGVVISCDTTRVCELKDLRH